MGLDLGRIEQLTDYQVLTVQEVKNYFREHFSPAAYDGMKMI
jgi:hypothetical protein